jgi:hypothetical protein
VGSPERPGTRLFGIDLEDVRLLAPDGERFRRDR